MERKNLMDLLVPVKSSKDILKIYRKTPIEKLFKYHNLKMKFKNYKNAEMLVGMCMDNRKYLRIPDNFAFILRDGGANFNNDEFKISYAIAIGKIKTFALIVHNHCGMVKLNSRKKKFINGLVKNAGWDKMKAKKHFESESKKFEIRNEINFALIEVKRFRKIYPKILIAPILFNVDDDLLYQIKES